VSRYKRQRRHIQKQHSLTFPLSTAAWIACTTATTSSGFTVLFWSLPKNACTSAAPSVSCLAARRAVLHRYWVERPASEERSCRSLVLSKRSAVSCSNFDLDIFMSRCLGPVASAVTKGRFILAFPWPWKVRSLHALLLLFSLWRAILSFLRSMPVLPELFNHPVDDSEVKVVAAEVGVAIRRLYLYDTFADLEMRYRKSAARSYTATFSSFFLSMPYARAAAVGSLIILSS